MKVAETIQSVRELANSARKQGKTIGFVPTMGALHVGHISLIEAAVKKCDFVVVSIFVNPAQFAPSEDLENYPRPFEDDLKICRKAGVDVVFAPSVGEMYSEENVTWVNVEKLTAPLCGQARPGHFRGVTTVCAKLFNIISPDIAFFGQKDAQQAVVIKKMVTDLNIALQIIVCPTVREPDGLAVSSRNRYLTAEQRKQATLIYKSLQKCRSMIDSGEKDSKIILDEIHKILQQGPAIKVEYAGIVDAQSLKSLERISGRVLIAVAAELGRARLIDNIMVDAGEQ